MKRFTLFLFCLTALKTSAMVWQIGPTRTYTYCNQIIGLVQDGDVIQIDFATYTNVPQVIWSKNNLLIEGVGGRPRLEAGSTIANDMVNGKGIFVISGMNTRVHNIEFANAAVVDNNGAGIRQEGANLTVTNCRFVGNENGILCGTIDNCKISVEYSEFLNSGSSSNPGYQHNIYIGNIDTFWFRFNCSRDAIAEGHELKSRAKYNFILYNRISNEQSVDSRTIDLPNGGTSVIVGNIIEQGANSANSNILGYGLEGVRNAATNSLYVTHNTFVNKKTSGSFIHISTNTETLFLKNNLFAGAKTGGLLINAPIVLDSSNNWVDNTIANFKFVNSANFDYHLQSNSPAINKGIALTQTVENYPLQASHLYKDHCDGDVRQNSGIIDIGAYEYLAAVPIELIDFQGIAEKEGNRLTWLFADMKDVRNIEILKSENGRDFTPLSILSKNELSFFDTLTSSKFQTSTTLNYYYKLKINELDGNLFFSKIIFIERKNKTTVKIYPSVTSSFLTIENAKSVEIVNAIGQLMMRHNVQNLQDFVHLSHFPNGIYFIKGIDTEGGIFTEKIVKQ